MLTQRKSLFLFFTLLFIILFFLPVRVLAWSGKAEIIDFTVSNKNGHIYIDAKLKGAFTREINEAIVSGIPTSFRFYLECNNIY